MKLRIPKIGGQVEPGFEPVKTAFAQNFRWRGEIGAALTVYHGGRRIVDLWGGVSDVGERSPWTADTLGVIFSSTKGLAALTALSLVDDGTLELDRPVADYWPEFGVGGKATISVRTLLNHRSGLVGVDEPLSLDDLEDPDRASAIIARQEPLWAPDTRQGYHATTFGLYVGELIRRATGGLTVGELVAERLAKPLEADVYLGLPQALEPRVARLYPANLSTRILKIAPRAITGLTLEGRIYRAVLKRGSPTQRAFANPAELGVRGIRNFDTPRVRKMQLPWANGMASARGLAKVYAGLIGADGSDGNRLVRRQAWEPVMKRQSWQEKDGVLLKPIGWSQGFVKDELHLFSPNPEAFGHPGAGGCLGWADPVEDLAIGYVMNSMDFHLRSRRALAICHALYRCLQGVKG